MKAQSVLDRARRESIERPVLLYAVSCPRCRVLARIILVLSRGAITGIALEEDEWRDFYAQELPQSRGSPVLVRRGVPNWGAWVFVITAWIALQGVFAASGRRR